MSALSLSYILLAVLLGTAAQLLLKAGTNATPVGIGLALEPRILGGIACYAVSLVAWVLALSKTPVSVAYPMVSLGFALNAVLAWWLLGEALTLQRAAGIAVIIAGVFLIARS
ncbi:MAG TPA: EamA family transporter [Burkholderiales bacterium]|nr:EamA family transporter [Burkholderiales bacterium]